MLLPSTNRHALRAAIMLLVVASACTKFTVRTDRNPEADFTRYRTFAWIPIADAPPADQDTGDRGLNNRIYSAVEAQLRHDGYAGAPNSSADLLVTFRLLKDAGFEDAKLPYAAQWHRGAYVEALHASSDSYDRGTLIVDAIDRTANVLVWRGSASARLLPHLSYQERAARAEDVVAKIFESFPAR
jgi:hypothetical protein